MSEIVVQEASVSAVDEGAESQVMQGGGVTSTQTPIQQG